MHEDQMGDLKLDDIKHLFEKQTAEIKAELKQALGEVNTKIIEGGKRFDLIENKLLAIERRARKNNVVIFGMKVDQTAIFGSTLQQINTLLGLKLSEGDVNNIYKIGKSDTAPIIVEFLAFHKKALIFKNRERLRGLRGTGISVSNDLCEADRESQKVLRRHLKVARGKNIPAKIEGFKIQIDGKWYTPQQLQEEESEYGSYTESETEADSQKLEGSSTGRNDSADGGEEHNRERKLNSSPSLKASARKTRGQKAGTIKQRKKY